MKKAILFSLAGFGLAALVFSTYAFKASADKKTVYTQITSVESVVSSGVGRSRMISMDAEGHYKESEIENLYSMVGFSFQNARKNDKSIADQINELTAQGWMLMNVNSNVAESDRNNAILLTRYLFRKEM